jgi:hypothetical protein
LTTPANHTTFNCDLTVDGAGRAVVSVYSVYAATADDPLTEHLVVHTLDSDARPFREALAFRGSGDSFVSGGAGDSFILGGDARDNAARGVLALVRGGEPAWIQTAVPSSGAGAGVGVSALTSSPDGETSVLAQRNPRWEAGMPDEYRYGISRFDGAGNLLWNMVLPTAYAGGYRAQMASSPEGDLIMRGKLPAATPDVDKVLIRKITRAGEVGWAFRLSNSVDDTVGVDETGRTVATSFKSVVVISADGQTCKQYGLPPVSDGIPFPSGVVASGGWLYSAQYDGVRRFRLPAE